MRVPKLDTQYVRWDRYRMFHVGVNMRGQTNTDYWIWPEFIVFDDGQVMCAFSEPKPEQRGFYSALNVSLVAANDDACPEMFLPDGTEVKKAWLKEGGQKYMLIDHDSKRVVQLKSRATGDPLETQLPDQARRAATAWFAGDGALPVGAPVQVAPPDKISMTREEREHVDTLICAFRAEVSMVGEEHPAQQKPRHYWTPSGHASPIDPQKLLDVESASMLSVEDQRNLWYRGISRRIKPYPYLLIE